MVDEIEKKNDVPYDENFLVRFWEKIDKKSDNECWKWIACKNKSGYGLISYREKTGRDVSLVASRVAYQIYNGKIPSRGAIHHSCGNSDCCNPNHLYLIKYKKVNIEFKKEEISKIILENIKINLKTGCWEFQKIKKRKNYGEIHYKGRVFKAHRLSYMLKHNNFNIPSTTKICHICDNPTCLNPDHLFAGTQRENIYDMEAKGRSNHVKGIENGNSKLNEKQVIKIRNEYSLRKISQQKLGEKYGTSSSMVGEIVRGNFWKHVGGKITLTSKGRIKYE